MIIYIVHNFADSSPLKRKRRIILQNEQQLNGCLGPGSPWVSRNIYFQGVILGEAHSEGHEDIENPKKKARAKKKTMHQKKRRA